LSAAIGNVANLTNSDYRLSYSAAAGGSYNLTRLSDNISWSADTLGNLQPFAATQGFTLDDGGVTPDDGDSFLIAPTRNGAHDIGVSVTDLRSIAAAAPIRTASITTNTGTGIISAGSVDGPPPVAPGLQNEVTITFTSPGFFNVTDNTLVPATILNPAPIAYDPSAGATVSYNGWTVQLSGTPGSGDSFTVGPNSNGVADNRNALLLGQLQTQNTLLATASGNPTANFQTVYAQIVSQVGNKTREIAVTQQARQSLATQAQNARDSVSGVNLDEEAASLIRYQQAYQAAAKVIAIADKLFDTILQL
jgi:flagellar hook-associated protein 1 FlgK